MIAALVMIAIYASLGVYALWDYAHADQIRNTPVKWLIAVAFTIWFSTVIAGTVLAVTS